jgi:hypothetical protein
MTPAEPTADQLRRDPLPPLGRPGHQHRRRLPPLGLTRHLPGLPYPARGSSSGGWVRSERMAGVTRAGPGSSACAASSAARTLVCRASGPIAVAVPSLQSAARTCAPGTTSRSRASLCASRPQSDRSAARAPSSTAGVAAKSMTTVQAGGVAARRRAPTALTRASAVPAHSWPVSRRHTICPAAGLASGCLRPARRGRRARRGRPAALRTAIRKASRRRAGTKSA